MSTRIVFDHLALMITLALSQHRWVCTIMLMVGSWLCSALALARHSPADLSLVLMYRLALWLSGSVALSALWLCRLCGLALAQPQRVSLEGDVLLLRSFCVLRSVFCFRWHLFVCWCAACVIGQECKDARSFLRYCCYPALNYVHSLMS